ncbi:MAG: ferredoxin reductase family protein [Roseibium sp.]|nr:ferredoxin reductase family protein [Roseibium sp.]
MRGLWLIGLYLGIVLAPLGLAATGAAPPRPALDELASGLGMLAFAILLAEFLLSGRFRAISGSVGMDITIRFHQLLARTCLVLAMVHPFLYTSPFGAPVPYDPTRQLVLTEPGVALATGAAAWVLLPAFVLISLGKSAVFKTYEGWRLAHGLGAALIAGFAWHHTVHAGRYAQDPLLKGLWTALFVVALLSLAFVYIVRPLTQSRKPWRVKDVRRAAERTWDVVLEPEGHAGLNYRAGQFAWINIGHSPFSLFENPFSIASAPAETGVLRFVIKEFGDFTSQIGSIEIGTEAYIDGPHGHMTVQGHTAPGIGLIAGGVGIAPMLSILRQLEADGDERPVTLIYGNRSPDQIVDGELLMELSTRPNIEIVHVVSEPAPDWQGEMGMISASLIERRFGAPSRRDWLYVLCGPPAMMIKAERTLLGLGVAQTNILSEHFTYD